MILVIIQVQISRSESDMDKMLIASMEYAVVEEFMVNGAVLPITVVNNLESAYAGEGVTRQMAQQVVASHLDHLKVVEHCERVGHEFVDDSHAGPEHGYMGVRCTRCNYHDGSFVY